MAKPSDYYDHHSQAYYQRTVDLDPAPYLDPFIGRLPTGARILDIGCGSGRDMKWLKSKGFQVTGLERSPELAALARQNAGCPVIEADFNSFDFASLHMDALLIAGALVHLPHHRFRRSFQRFLPAIGDFGRIYLSLKKGIGHQDAPDGRRFFLWQDHHLRPLLISTGCRVLDLQESVSILGTEEIWLGYLIAPGPGYRSTE